MISIVASRPRLPGLDLLRAAAILLVLTWHFPAAVWPWREHLASWAGVDLFFVLSGYLIGSQLLRPYLQGLRPSYGDFFLRRLLRVAPAYLVVLLLYFTLPGFRETRGISPLWRFLTFTQNLGLDASVHGTFSQAWSLCVEEHFYLLLPLLVYALMHRPSLVKTGVLAGGLMVGGILLRRQLWLHDVRPLLEANQSVVYPFLESIYYPTYTRLDGLLVGVLLAALKLFRPSAWNRLIAYGNVWLVGGLILVVAAFWICQDMFSFATAVVGYPLLALGFGLLVLASLSPESALARHRLPGLTWIAVLAYSTYLTHKEIMHLDQVWLGPRVQLAGPWGLVIYLSSFSAAAAMLYFCVERPFLGLCDRWLGTRLKAVGPR